MSNDKITTPGYREAYNINPKLAATNVLDENENPTGGQVRLDLDTDGDKTPEFPVLLVRWQSEPRGTGETNADGSPKLKAPNGAFVEDVIWAALQRLEFFNEGKYRDRGNSIAITKLEEALQALKDRQLQRSYRGVEGEHKV
jgi:hypothetical protein